MWGPRGAQAGPSRGRPRRGGQGRKQQCDRSVTRPAREAARFGERALRTPCAPSRCEKDPSTRQPTCLVRAFANTSRRSQHCAVLRLGRVCRSPQQTPDRRETHCSASIPLEPAVGAGLLATSCGVSPVVRQELPSCRLKFLVRTRLVTRWKRAVILRVLCWVTGCSWPQLPNCNLELPSQRFELSYRLPLSARLSFSWRAGSGASCSINSCSITSYSMRSGRCWSDCIEQ